MSTISIASITIPDWWQSTTVGVGVVQLRVYATQSFLTSTGTIVPGGSPNGGALYKLVNCDVAANGINFDLTIPAFNIDSTTDSPDPVSTSTRYVTWFFVGKRMLGPAVLGGPTGSFRILPVYSQNPATWADIWLDNTQGAIQSYDLITYTKEQINYLISQGVGAGGITMLNGLSAAHQTFVNDTNVTIVSAGTTQTLTWVGTLAVARGGTGSASAAGARTNLGAAASGANADITSLTGLTTALTSPQGGTGFGTANPYTVGSLLYANTTTSLTQITPGVAGFVLLSQGAGLAPVWAAAAGTIGGGGASGRVAFWSAATTLSSAATYLWDGTHLSVATADATNTVNLPNAGYMSGRGTVAAAQLQAIGVADAVHYTGVASQANIDAVWLAKQGTPVAYQLTDGGAAAINPLAPDYQIRAAGIRVGLGFAGAINDNATSNFFGISSYVTSIGTAPVTAGFFQATALGSAASVWGLNPVSYTDVGGVLVATSHAVEGDFGSLGVSANQQSFGIVLGSNAGGATPAGCVRAFVQIQRQTSSPAAASAVDGIVFNPGAGQPVTNALVLAAGITSNYLIDGSGSTFSAGINFFGSTFSNAAIVLPNTNQGIFAQDTGGTERSVLALNTANFVALGDTVGTAGTRIYAASTVPTMALTAGAAALVGNVGFNQLAPTAQQHVTAINKRALSATPSASFVVVNGSPAVAATLSAFTTELAPGSSIEFSSQPGTLYTVLSIASDIALTLTGNYTGINSGGTATAKSDYRTLLIESASGEDWLELDNQHVLKLYGDSAYSDLRGMLTLVSRVNSQKRLTIGINDTSSYGYISNFQETVGWKPLLLQAGAAGTAVGGVVIGTNSPSMYGAMLKVEGAQTNPGANNVGSEFNNLSTSNAYFQKIAAQYLSAGSWVGPSFGLYSRPLNAVDAAAEDITNVPIGAFGGKSFFGPDASQVTSPAPPVNLFTAVVDIYGVRTDSITRSGATVTTVNGNATINNTAGGPTTWNTPGAADYVQPGDTVEVSNEAGVIYTVTSVTGNTAFDVTPVIAGGGAGLTLRRDPYLMRLRNSYGTERLRIEPSGNMFLGGAAIQGAKTKVLTASVATSFVTIMVPSSSYVGGYLEYTVVCAHGGDFQSRSGILPFAAVNKAGTETVTIGTVTTATEVVAVSAGTLAVTLTGVTTPTNGISLQANAVSSLNANPTTLEIRYHVRMTSGTQVTVTPL